MKKQKMLVLTSGGRTSQYMAKRLMDEYQDEYEMVRVFANTGQEMNETLDFVHQCDVQFGFNTVWIEADVRAGRNATAHKIVTYETAHRSGEPFEWIVDKYGIPNASYPHCTRELKENPIHSYVRSLGWKKGEYLTAIGIRADEPRRVKRTISSQNKQIRVYPLVDLFPSDKWTFSIFGNSRTLICNSLSTWGIAKPASKNQIKSCSRFIGTTGITSTFLHTWKTSTVKLARIK